MGSVKATIRRSKAKKNGKVPICLRVIVNRQNTYISLRRYIKPNLWDANKERITGKSDEAAVLNVLINKEKSKYQKIIDQFIIANKQFTLEDVLLTAKGKVKNESSTVIVEMLENFISTNPEGLKTSSMKYYIATMKTLLKYDPKISFDKLNRKWLEKFEKYLVQQLNHKPNTVYNKMKVIRAINNRAIREELTINYPFKGFKIRAGKSKREFLTMEELNLLNDASSIPRFHRLVLDIFLFSAYTGLRFGDICLLRPENIIHEKKKFRLYFTISKTQENISFVLPDKAVEILQKYNLTKDKQVFPIISSDLNNLSELEFNRLKESRNAFFNRVIKRIASEVGISKNVSMHIARHSFATISLEKGIPIEVVSSLLGHSNITTTQIYAKVVDKSRDKAMELWNKKE